MEKGLKNSVGNWKFLLVFIYKGIFFSPPGAKNKTQSSVLEPQMDVLREPSLRGEKGKKHTHHH